MRAVRIHEHGGPEVMRIETVSLPAPSEGQALVRHEAVGLNFIDVYHRTGLYPLTLPSGLGVEAVGLVEAVGPGVTIVKPGDRVAYAGGALGAYADARLIAADRLVRVPEGLDATKVAATLLKGMTAEFLTFRTYSVKAGETVLLHAAAGGVGLLASQWLRARGVHVIGTVGSEAKAELARRAGCEHVIVYTRENFVARVRELTGGRGVPVVYDSVGKDTFEGSLDCLSPRGLLVCFGNASGKPPAFDVQTLAAKGSLYLTRASLFAYTATREDLELSASRVFEALGAGVLTPHIGATFALGDVAEAHRALEARKTVGSTVLVP